MTLPDLGFAVPGDLSARTGGTLYDRRLVEALRGAGRIVEVAALPATYPFPDARDEDATARLLAGFGPATPVILDGLAYGAMSAGLVASFRFPAIALVHHPVGLEPGLPPDLAADLLARERHNLARASAVLVPSPHIAALLTDDFAVPRDRITVALPGFPRPDPVRDPADPPLILSVGLLARRKGHDVLIAALARIADLRWSAVIVGRDHEPGTASALARQIAQAGLGTRVTLAGEIDDTALRDLYRRAGLFALATRYEGYGLVFGEAMGHGLPIVGCAAGAVPDTVPPDAGLLVPPDDPAAFAGALRRVLTDPALRRALETGSASAGAVLPRWSDTASAVLRAIERLART